MGICTSCAKHRVDPGSDMPFWKKEKDGQGDKANLKARLEHKQYLAQESPEPVYDLSECGLKNVPSGVFSRCRIMRKQALLLQDNELTSITGGGSLSDLGELTVLDLHNNCLDKLPEDIGALHSLTTLYLQNNKLKQLPSSLGSLTHLTSLNLSGNLLKELPATISKLSNLRMLDLTDNVKLKKMPRDLCRCRCLDTLLVDQHISYPPSDIISQGTEAIMRFLCKECDIEYISPSQCLPTSEPTHGHASNGDHKLLDYHDPIQDVVTSHLAKAEQIKEQKKQHALMLERQLAQTQEAEARLKVQSVEVKRKLLEDLAEEESKKIEETRRIQQTQQEDKERLFKKMNSAEKQTDLLISELMSSSSRYSDSKKVMEALEAEQKEMERKFIIQQHDVDKLKETEVLRSMQLMMEDELQREATRRQYEQRQGIVQQAISNSLNNDKAVEAVLASKGKHQDELLSKMLEDEKYQREAFQSLLLKQDDKSQEISDQMDRIQNELASLTMVEMKKRDMKVEFELEVLNEKRETLTQILLDLMKRKKERVDDIQELLGKIEKDKSADQDNYWLIQYQKLLDSKPEGVHLAEADLDSQVKKIIVEAGADRFIPIFASKNVTMKQLSYADDTTLRQIGVDSEYLRNQILLVIEQFLSASNGTIRPSAPSASLDETAPSAPMAEPEDDRQLDGGERASSVQPSSVIETFKTGECVVCMERKSEIIFLPCGHLCSCVRCEPDLTHCPLCRTPIQQRVHLG